VISPKGLSGNNCIILAADASRLAALLVGHMRPACYLLAPGDPGASTPRMAHLFPDRPYRGQPSGACREMRPRSRLCLVRTSPGRGYRGRSGVDMARLLELAGPRGSGSGRHDAV